MLGKIQSHIFSRCLCNCMFMKAAFKIRLTRKGDAFSILKLEKETADENGGDGGANNLASKRDEGLAKQVTPNMAKEIQERDGETEKEISEPANKRTKHGKNSMPQIVSESGGYGSQEGNYPGMKEDSLLHGAFATHSNTTSQKECVGGAGKPVPSVSVSEGTKAFQDGVTSAVLGTGTMQQVNTAENTASRESLVQEIYPIPSHAGEFYADLLCSVSDAGYEQRSHDLEGGREK